MTTHMGRTARFSFACFSALGLIMATLFSPSLRAAPLEVAGVPFSETATVAGQPLILNGAGLRKKVFFKVYAMGFYLPAKAGTADAALNSPAPQRIRIHTLRDLSADQLESALIEGMKNNLDEAAFVALKPRIDAFAALLRGIGSAPEGTEILLDRLPGKGVQLTVGSEVRGQPVAGDDFARALLSVWLGKVPAQDDLKTALLGKAG